MCVGRTVHRGLTPIRLLSHGEMALVILGEATQFAHTWTARKPGIATEARWAVRETHLGYFFGNFYTIPPGFGGREGGMCMCVQMLQIRR